MSGTECERSYQEGLTMLVLLPITIILIVLIDFITRKYFKNKHDQELRDEANRVGSETQRFEATSLWQILTSGINRARSPLLAARWIFPFANCNLSLFCKMWTWYNGAPIHIQPILYSNVLFIVRMLCCMYGSCDKSSVEIFVLRSSYLQNYT